MFNDPSGEIIVPILIGAAIGAAIGVLTNGINNTINNQGFFKGWGKAALIGGISGAISFGIGEMAASMANAGASAFKVGAFQAYMHGLSGMTMNIIQGADPLAGFAAGALSSIVGGAAGKWAKGMNSKAWQGVIQIGAGGVSGGAGSVIGGGNFWDGFRQGSITAGLNHFAHEIRSNITLRSKLRQAGINPRDIPFFSEYEAYLVATSALDDLYEQAGRPEFKNVRDLVDSNGNPAKGIVSSSSTTSEMIGPVRLSQNAYRNYFQLASTVGHELIHVIDIVSGNMSNWINSGGAEYARYRSEYNAYNWQNSVQATYNFSQYRYYRTWYHSNH